MHKDLISLRKSDPVFSAQDRFSIDGAILSSTAFVVRYFAGDSMDRLLVINSGVEFSFEPAAEPLLAPIENGRWQHIFSSEDIKYGGEGALNPLTEAGWQIPAVCANVFRAES